MQKLFFLKLCCWAICIAACADNKDSGKRVNDSLFTNGSVIIECPDFYSYYAITFNNGGEVALGFCYKKSDTINYTIGGQDSIIKLAVFQISEDDSQYINTLLLPVITMDRMHKHHSHDSFKYSLQLDGVKRIESDTSNDVVNNLLKTLMPYFPKDIASYDFCGFFSVFKTIPD